MSSRTPGTRVWAIREADDETVYAYGFGTYVGDHPRPGWAPGEKYRALVEQVIRECDAEPVDLGPYFDHKVGAGDMTREEADAHLVRAAERREADMARPMAERVEEHLHRSSLNPKIVLDDGRGVVWGFECWWCPADDDTPEGWAKGRRIVLVEAPHDAETQPQATPCPNCEGAGVCWHQGRGNDDYFRAKCTSCRGTGMAGQAVTNDPKGTHGE